MRVCGRLLSHCLCGFQSIARRATVYAGSRAVNNVLYAPNDQRFMNSIGGGEVHISMIANDLSRPLSKHFIQLS